MVVIEDEPKNTLIETFNEAFRSKVGTDTKPTITHKFIEQNRYMLHQIYPTGTWFIDLVKFGDYWYVFFVEACSRYLIVIQGNSNFLTNDAVEVNINQRVRSRTFLEAFHQFERINDKPVKLIIGDSERAFWSNIMMDYYKSRRIAIKKINISEEGHIGMSILDRLVRTIRDMCFKLKLPESVEPKDMINVVITYNNTFHSTLTKYLEQRYSPLDVHNDIELQRKFRDLLSIANLHVRLLTEFELPIGIEVIVKKEKSKKFEKIRTNTLPGKWYVEDYNSTGYTIKNNETNEILTKVPRSRLRPIY